MTNEIQAVLFDLDDTLYHRKAAFRAWAERFAQEQGVATHTPEGDALLADLEACDGNGYGSRSAFAARIRHHFPAVSGTADEVLEQFRVGFVQELTLAPETAALLHILKALAIPFGIVTNGSARQQQRKIERLGLHEHTDCVFISEAFGVKKPDRRIFLAAAECLGVTPDAVLFVGDHGENDILGAKQVGMQTAWVGYGMPWPAERAADPPDHCLDTVHDVVTLLPLPPS